MNELKRSNMPIKKIHVLRQLWVLIVAVGIVLFTIADLTLRLTNNVILFPTVMLIGTFLIPVAFTAYFYQQENLFDNGLHAGSILPTLLMCALFGGLIGALAASILESKFSSNNSLLSLMWVGPIEEFAKLIVPIAIFVIMRKRFRSEMDGLLFGVAAGMAFAVLESLGYEFITLINSHGSLLAVNDTILVRGLLSPMGHASWTGLITATIWHERERKRNIVALVVMGFFLISASLHSLWDFVSSLNNMTIIITSYIAIGGLSLGLLTWRVREAEAQRAESKSQFDSAKVLNSLVT